MKLYLPFSSKEWLMSNTILDMSSRTGGLMVEAPRCCRPRTRTSSPPGRCRTGSFVDHGTTSGLGYGLDADVSHYDRRGLKFTSYTTLSSNTSSSRRRGYYYTESFLRSKPEEWLPYISLMLRLNFFYPEVDTSMLCWSWNYRGWPLLLRCLHDDTSSPTDSLNCNMLQSKLSYFYDDSWLFCCPYPSALFLGL